MEMQARFSTAHAIRSGSPAHASSERLSSKTVLQRASKGNPPLQARGGAMPVKPQSLGSALPTGSPAGVHEFVRATNHLFHAQAKALEFVVSMEPQRVAVRLIDLEFGEVIREYEVGSAPLLDETLGEFVPGRLLSAIA